MVVELNGEYITGPGRSVTRVTRASGAWAPGRYACATPKSGTTQFALRLLISRVKEIISAGIRKDSSSRGLASLVWRTGGGSMKSSTQDRGLDSSHWPR